MVFMNASHFHSTERSKTLAKKSYGPPRRSKSNPGHRFFQPRDFDGFTAIAVIRMGIEAMSERNMKSALIIL